MESQEIIKFILPEDMLEYFDLVNIERLGNQLRFYLDEKNEKPPELSAKSLESKGFTPPLSLYDFPIRNQKVVLKVRRRKWKDTATGKTHTREWDLKHEGTSYTKEFAAFLKKMYGHQTS
ncbi:ISAon1 family transposase N-terminal region protein [Candidatus Electrothrix sp.]|uniref:ISAon1 family transposase N-terminal region protein n=1 Tax=Candidatus Electrothrix sp. TaxID=2170559 RepID=UPI0040570D9C